MEYPEKLRYSKEHEWAMLENGIVTIGITDYAQSELGDVVYVELPAVDSQVTAGETFGVVESVKSVSDLYSPVSGKVKEINTELDAEPETVNSSPYGQGWIIKVDCGDESELDKLMSARQYTEYVASL
ncbi:MAG: glycine cleavage system protein GcvH [Nitrospinota bacterium]